MYIIDRNEDYYDYLSHIYGVDKKVVFDRRGSERITDKNLVVIPLRYRLYDQQYCVLEVGETQYLIEINNIQFSRDKTEYLSSDMEVIREFNDRVNKFGRPISIRNVFLNFMWRRDRDRIIASGSFNELVQVNRCPIVCDNPIIAGTQLTKLFNPEHIWRKIENYISSLNNDLDVETPMTERSKAELHGFDKNSFRHPVK